MITSGSKGLDESIPDIEPYMHTSVIVTVLNPLSPL